MRVLFQRRKHVYSFVLKRFAVLWASFRIHKWIKKTAEKKGIGFIYRNRMKKNTIKMCEVKRRHIPSTMSKGLQVYRELILVRFLW